MIFGVGVEKSFAMPPPAQPMVKTKKMTSEKLLSFSGCGTYGHQASGRRLNHKSYVRRIVCVGFRCNSAQPVTAGKLR